jgi:hypothetical protein
MGNFVSFDLFFITWDIHFDGNWSSYISELITQWSDCLVAKGYWVMQQTIFCGGSSKGIPRFWLGSDSDLISISSMYDTSVYDKKFHKDTTYTYRHSLSFHTYGEILYGPYRLRAVIFISRHLHLTKGVFLSSEVCLF